MTPATTDDIRNVCTDEDMQGGLRVESMRGLGEVLRDLFYDGMLVVLWLATLWLLVMDVITS